MGGGDMGNTDQPSGSALFSSMETLRALEAEVAAARQDPHRRFGPFIVLSELGKGGMGAVYRAWDERLRRLVALKTLLAQDGAAEAIQRFRREAEAVARLKHPNIVSVFEVGDVQGRP